jgi:hypothetical protein
MRFKLMALFLGLSMVMACEGNKTTGKGLTELLTSESVKLVTFKVFGNAPCFECSPGVSMVVSAWDKDEPATMLADPLIYETAGQFAMQVSAKEGHTIVVETKMVKPNTGLTERRGVTEIEVPDSYEIGEDMPVVKTDIDVQDPTKDLKTTIHEGGEVPPPETK